MNKRHTPGRLGDGPRMNNVILSAASASAIDIRLVKVASFGVIVVGTGISCVALIFVLPGRPSNAGSKTKDKTIKTSSD